MTAATTKLPLESDVEPRTTPFESSISETCAPTTKAPDSSRSVPRNAAAGEDDCASPATSKATANMKTACMHIMGPVETSRLLNISSLSRVGLRAQLAASGSGPEGQIRTLPHGDGHV